MQTDLSSKASVTELHSVETNLKSQIDSKASEMDLQTLKVRDCIYYFYRIQINGKSYFFQTDISGKASLTELHSVETNLQNQMNTKITKMACPTGSPGYYLAGNKCRYSQCKGL